MSDCVYKPLPRGWHCSRRKFHPGPCALRPHWYNLLGQIVYRYF